MTRGQYLGMSLVLSLAGVLPAQDSSSKVFISGVVEASRMPHLLLFVPLDEQQRPNQTTAPVEIALTAAGVFTGQVEPGSYAVAYHPPCGRVSGFHLVAGADSVKLALAWIPDDMRGVRAGTSTAMTGFRAHFGAAAPALGAAYAGGNLSPGAQAVAGTRLPFDPKLVSGDSASSSGRGYSGGYSSYVPNLTSYKPPTLSWTTTPALSLNKGLTGVTLPSISSGLWTSLGSLGSSKLTSPITLYTPILSTLGSPVSNSSFYTPWKPISIPAPALPTFTTPTFSIGKPAGGVFLDTHLYCE